MIRKASVVWNGDGRTGTGRMTTQSGVLKDSVYGFKTRFENEPGTNPEELIAAAHAGCFSMALAFGRASILDEARRDWYLQRATIALDTTRSALLERKPWHSQDVTLCHGLAGLVDSLWYGATELRLDDFEEVAAASGTAIAEGWLAGRPWHSGVSCGGPNDSVMLGLSGVGLSLFRLRNSAITSPLLPVTV